MKPVQIENIYSERMTLSGDPLSGLSEIFTPTPPPIKTDVYVKINGSKLPVPKKWGSNIAQYVNSQLKELRPTESGKKMGLPIKTIYLWPDAALVSKSKLQASNFNIVKINKKTTATLCSVTPLTFFYASIMKLDMYVKFNFLKEKAWKWDELREAIVRLFWYSSTEIFSSRDIPRPHGTYKNIKCSGFDGHNTSTIHFKH